jgi:hypothetical protein
MNLIRSLYKFFTIIFFIWVAMADEATGQPVPGKDENIPYLVTFGKSGKVSWGDDDFNQVFFFSLLKDYKQPFYIRVLDPDCGGEIDEIQGDFNTKTQFSVYGGKGVDPDRYEESRGVDNGLNYKSGNLLATKIFGSEARYDNKWYTFGPFNPAEGDFNEKWNSNIFKIVCEGISGDDGNLYRYYLSSNPDNNIPIEGANAFTYEYTFRMWNDFTNVAHIYPYVDTGIVSIKVRNFDWDNDGNIIVVSRYRIGSDVKPLSNEANWTEPVVPIEPAEVKSSLDFQIHKRKGELVKNNNVVLILENQRKQAIKFFSSPIGGVPVYVPKPKYEKLPAKK